jgi:fatty acyl-CoA reductase
MESSGCLVNYYKSKVQCSFVFCTKDELQHLRRLSNIHYYHRVIENSSLAIFSLFFRLNVKKQLTEVPPAVDDDISILNYVSSAQNPLTLSQYMKYNEVGKEFPSLQVLWYYSLQLHKHRILHNVCAVFLHLLPAIIVDTVAKLVGKKPM